MPLAIRWKHSSFTWRTGLKRGRCGMKRRVQGLHRADQSAAKNLPEGFFLVRVIGALYRWHAFKPYYLIRFSILEPKEIAGTDVASHFYCTPKALWKLNWFLRDFGYDPELLGKD